MIKLISLSKQNRKSSIIIYVFTAIFVVVLYFILQGDTLTWTALSLLFFFLVTLSNEYVDRAFNDKQETLK